MNYVIQPVGPSQARANRLRWWWQRRMGWAGGVALVCLGLCAALLGAVRPAVDAQRKSQVEQQLLRLDALAKQRGALPAAQPADSTEELRASIPALAQRGETVARLLDLAGASGIHFDRAEYAQVDQEPNLSRLKVTLPFGGSYAQTRAVIARVLNGMPNAALDSIDIERPDTELKTLEGTLRISLYFRKDAP
jgi:hypothetical protein